MNLVAGTDGTQKGIILVRKSNNSALGKGTVAGAYNFEARINI